MSNLAGERLVEARNVSGLDPQTIASRIHISTQQYLALERGDYQRLRGDVFVRGYLRTCAAILNLDSAQLLQLYSQDMGSQQNENTKHEPSAKLKISTRLNSPSYISRGLILLICMTVFAMFVVKRLEQPSRDANLVEAPVVAHIDEASIKPPEEKLQLVEEQPPHTAEVAAPIVETMAVTPAAVPAQQSVISENIATGARLHIDFNNNCWLKISDHDKEIFQGVKTHDAPLNITGTPPFEVMIGNVSAISKIELNGEAVSFTPEAGKNTLRMLIPAVAKSVQP